MGSGFQFVDIIFFALIAAFIILRLRSVLGKRTGHEQPRERVDPFEARKTDRRAPAEGPDANDTPVPEGDNVVRLPGRNGQEIRAETPLGAGLTQIRVADPGFDPADFVEKSKAAFEYIVLAFAEGEADKLKPLLSKEVYDGFASAIKAREENGETLETAIVRVISAELTAAAMTGRTASITVTYRTEQINVTRDAQGEVVAGDPDRFSEIEDVWTFERDTRSSNPNWLLVATETPDETSGDTPETSQDA